MLWIYVWSDTDSHSPHQSTDWKDIYTKLWGGPNAVFVLQYFELVVGFVFNQHHIFDMLRDGDPRVKMEGDITLIKPSEYVP